MPTVMGEAPEFEFDACWRLHPMVALRPEPFGALLYHFGTRKLSFLKNQTVVDLVRALPSHPDAWAAFQAAGIDSSAARPYVTALSALVRSNMLVRATADSDSDSQS